MRFLLDTNVLEHVANRARNRERIQDQIERAGIANRAISTITAYELRKHIELGPGRVRKENIERLKIMLAAVRSIPASLAIADAAGHLAAHLAEHRPNHRAPRSPDCGQRDGARPGMRH